MVERLLRPCVVPGCSALTTGGRCRDHARRIEQARGSATARGYDARWRRFRRRFVATLIARDILPVCGARLAGTPSPSSRCAADGLLTARSADGSDLHFDHDPPLTDVERSDWRAVCDETRIVLLCAEDHNRKTQHEQQPRIS